MGVWDESTPVGTDLINAGDDRIRELKVALGEALSHENSTFPGATPASTPIFIPGFSRDTTANRPTGDSLVTGRLYINTTLGQVEWYDGAAWQPVSVVFEATTAMVFYQAAAPTGWTAVSVDDKFLRAVTEGSGSGGSTGGSGLAPTDSISLAHTHTVDAHSHSVPVLTIDFSTITVGPLNVAGDGLVSTDSNGSTMALASGGSGTFNNYRDGMLNSTKIGTTGTDNPATDTKLANISFKYADVIVATKD